MLTTKSVNELIHEKREFLIPDYQRGYRWTEVEITQLLEDIRSFENRDGESFYCLQPLVVVAPEPDGPQVWEVVDGQQRLTTVHLILKYLDRKRLSRIEYERREDSWRFIEQLSIADMPNYETIDGEYLSRAYKTIHEWFEEIIEPRDLSKKAKVAFNIGDQVQFIWYEIDSAQEQGTQRIEIFNRLNIGKIGLTNAELIKALVLQDDNFPDSGREDPRRLAEMQKYQVAHEWDAIERRLHDPDFWAFINRTGRHGANRIDFLFELHAKLVIKGTSESLGKGEHGVFEFYLREINRSATSVRTKKRQEFVLGMWDGVRRLLDQLEEWYCDRELYHLVGYLVYVGVSLDAIIEMAHNSKKSEFRQAAIARIRTTLPDDPSNDLRYTGTSSKDKRVQDYLLLFNIATVLDDPKGDQCVSFRHFKGIDSGEVEWSLEHIHAQNSQYLHRIEEKTAWLDDHRKFLDHFRLTAPELAPQILELIKRIDNVDRSKIPQEEFVTLFDDVIKFFQEEDEDAYDTDWIGNLTLLDSSSNSALGNSVFALKRERIRRRISNGSYVLPVTRNVFEKAYTKHVGNLAFWTEVDRQAYVERMIQMINRLLGVSELGDDDGE
jgi:hypothetical protein